MTNINRTYRDKKILKNRIILVFGMPRSGTTWLGKIFDSHMDLIYLHEPDSEIKLKGIPLLVRSNCYSKYQNIVKD